MRTLGVDIGAARVRVLELAHSSAPRIENVAARALPAGASSSGRIHDPETVAEALAECVRELAPRRGRLNRALRCVASIAESDARISSVTLPPMSWAGRRSAIALQTRDIADFEVSDCVVTVEDRGKEPALLGIAGREALTGRVLALKRAGLHPIAVDHAALALARAFPREPAVLDIGLHSATLIVARANVPDIALFPFGGAAVTAGIARSRAIASAQAEARKRTAGLELDADLILGAGLAQLNERLTHFRKQHDIAHMTLTGNGSRLQGLAEAIERATGISAKAATFDPQVLERSAIPPHVVAANACDWALALGNALWPVARKSSVA